MLRSMLPSRLLIAIVAGMGAACLGAAFTAVPVAVVAAAAAACGTALVALVGLDAWVSGKRWRQAPLVPRRRLPAAFALGRCVRLRLTLDNAGTARWRGRLFELADASIVMPGMPLSFDVGPAQRQVLEFEAKPTERGLKSWDRCQIMLRSAFGLFDWNLTIGSRESRRVFPNFEHQSTLAWLRERRAPAAGIKAVRRRGAGTDFDQLTEYRAGDPIRHIDWKATQRHDRPIARTFRDDRDQCVIFLLDCGRRMRADDALHGIGATHFDQALNALMLLAFVALKFGDAVGAITFGTPDEATKRYAPRKGRRSLNALMAELSEVRPTPVFSDYAKSAADLLMRQRKRALVVMVTNCRDEDAPELTSALHLLCSRHRVVLANLREQIVGSLAEQSVDTVDRVLEIAAALEYQQRRADMMRRFAQSNALTIDCEPARLGVELVNKYTVLKRTGAI
jgi:uncharacterized protein (DUF58 family)